MTKKILNANEYHAYFQRYIDQVDLDTSLKQGLRDGLKAVGDFFEQVPQDKSDFAYAEGKWTIKQVFQHIIDTERIFAYRLFRIGRGDKAPLASFNQDIYIEPSHALDKAINELLSEFLATRKFTISLVDSLGEADLAEIGTSSDQPLSARAAGFIILGHVIWHMNIVRERYLAV